MTKNAICLVVDRLRASALGAYGNTWYGTPTLDRLAGESLTLDFAFADSPRLDLVYRGYWEGLCAMRPAACSSGVGHHDRNLISTLARHGIAPTLITDDPCVVDYPVCDAFDECALVESRAPTRAAIEVEETEMARLFATATQWLEHRLETAPRSPFFLWIHGRGMGSAWDAPLAFRQQLVDEGDPLPSDSVDVPSLRLSEDFDPDELFGTSCCYSGQAMLLDPLVGTLLHQLRESPLLNDTLWLFAGARGFPLGEHGRVGDADPGLYGEQVHVPWFVRIPDGSGAMLHNPALVQPTDLFSTILDWFDLDPQVPCDGHSLLSCGRSDEDAMRHGVAMIAGDQRAVRTPDWHFYLPDPSSPELYAKPDDRWEANNVAGRCPETATGLRNVLEELGPLVW